MKQDDKDRVNELREELNKIYRSTREREKTTREKKRIDDIAKEITKIYDREIEEMRMSNHTPGQWESGGASMDGVHVLCGDRIICYCHSYIGEGIESTKANARLIAAAPDLLDVLIDLQESALYWSEYFVPVGIVDRINAAIAKATGNYTKEDT